MFFFFYATASTDIYTDLHTLSLLDALPICLSCSHLPFLLALRDWPKIRVSTLSIVIPATAGIHMPSGAIPMRRVCWIPAFAGMTMIADRSEEHTSELQSLMRISYAVFCLKKKTKSLIHTHKIVPGTRMSTSM